MGDSQPYGSVSTLSPPSHPPRRVAVLDETPRRAARPALGTADEGRRVLCERLALGWRIWLPVRSAVLSLAAALRGLLEQERRG